MSGFVAGNCIDLLHNGSEYFPALEAACDGARREIYLETYIFADDATGRRIAAALSRAAKRGVAVCLLIDGFGSRELGEVFLNGLRDDGVRCVRFRPQI